MRFVRTLIPLSVIFTLGVGVACKKPAPAPVAPVKPAEVVAPAPPDDSAQRLADEEAARRKAEADAEAARKAAAAAAEMQRAAAFKNAAEAALKDINFDFDKSDIREMDKAKLQAIADFLKTYPDAKIQIAGNCDERGTVEYNLALGERRAKSARDYMVNMGVKANRVSTISYGKERPVALGHDEDAWAKNRRDEFVEK